MRILYPQLFEPVAPVAAPPPTVFVDRWFQPASQPRAKPNLTSRMGAIFWSGFTPTVAPETVTLDKWYQPTSVPTRRVSGAAQLATTLAWSGFTPTVAPETITLDKWYQPASLPTRRKIAPAPATTLAWSGFTPTVVPPVLGPLPLPAPDLKRIVRSRHAALVSTGIFVPVISSVITPSGRAIVNWLD